MERMVPTLLFLQLYFSSISAQQERCGSIGNSSETAVTPTRAKLFYLDTANPANCTGNITSWRVCYYGPESIDNLGSYWATYAIYRRIGSGDSVRYERVSGVFRAIRAVAKFTTDPIVDGEIVQGGFNCFDDFIDAHDSPVTIQAGDILGTCVFDPNDLFLAITRLSLDVVGEVSGESTPLLQMGTTGCFLNAIPSNISANQLSTLNSTRLHIHANIAAAATLPSQMPNTTMATTESAPTTTGTRSINIVAIAAGSAGGGFMLLLVTIVLSGTCLILKRKDYINLPTTSKVRVEVDEIVTNTNVAYKPVQQTATVQAVNPHELNVTYDTAGQQGEGTTDHEPQQAEATENRASTDDAQISLTSNVAYHKFAKPLQENDHTYDQYDYI